jgi:hypothetical protein
MQLFQALVFLNLEDRKDSRLGVSDKDAILVEADAIRTWEGPRYLSASDILFPAISILKSRYVSTEGNYRSRSIAVLHMSRPRPRTQFLF